MATKSSYQSAQELNQRAAARSKGQKLSDMLTGRETAAPSGAGRGWVNPSRSDMNDGGSSTEYEQYLQEKRAGGAGTRSYSEWKKL